MPGFLAGTIQFLGRHTGNAVSYVSPWILVAGIGIGGIIAAFLLAIPVMTDKFMAEFSVRARRVAPRIFLIGLSVLLLGIFTGFVVFDIIGSIMIAAVLLGWLAVNY